MNTYKHIHKVHQAHLSWRKELTFFKKEILFFQKKLEIIKKLPDFPLKDHLINYYSKRFTLQIIRIDDLMKLINIGEKNIKEYCENNPVDVEEVFFKDSQSLRKAMKRHQEVHKSIQTSFLKFIKNIPTGNVVFSTNVMS